MKHKLTKQIIFAVAIIAILLSACNKILNDKSDKSLVVPNSIADYQALLDNVNTMNNCGSWDEVSADNYYLPDATFNSEQLIGRNTYLWQNYVYYGPANDWAFLYDIVYYSNLALEGISQTHPTNMNMNDWDNVKGSALFYRAQSFLQTVFIFCKTYDSATAGSDYGIALRLSSDFNQSSHRANLTDSYNQIISDLKAAIPLLPLNPVTVYRPSKPAAYALLARTYLSMRDYSDAGLYADSCLQLKNDLIDYNSINLSALNPFPATNKEVIFQRYASVYSFFTPTEERVDTLLYKSYSNTDLRKQAFFYPFTPGYIFRGNYSGDLSSFFTGIATDEVYITRAECYAREGKTDLANDDLNTLLKTRWQTGAFVSFSETAPQKLLDTVLSERRKELAFRSLRWMDIKRLNKEGANISLKRVVNGQAYTLSPDDNRFALPLPADVINISGMPQNVY